jgi:hypothetical protein
MTILDVRTAAAAALAPLEDGDPDVLVDVVDAISPPCLMLDGAEPWIEPTVVTGAGRTMGPCRFTYGLLVHCIAGRVEPGPGFAELERLVAFTIGRLAADVYQWPVGTAGRPGQVQIAGVWYLGAALTYRVPITIP